jgi:HAD superfamily hydrolase (TIGR01662 family)
VEREPASSPAPVRAVLFDFGHTLVDFRRTEDALYAAYERVRDRIEAAAYMEVPEILDLIERVANEIDRQVQRSYEERRMEELDLVVTFRSALMAIGFDLPPDIIDHIVALDHSAYSNSLGIEPEVLETVRRLHEGGYRLGLVSNVSLLPHLMREDLERLGLTPFLTAAVFSSEVGVRKPDARIFVEALGRVGAVPQETVFVGDRLRDDVEGARALGMRTVLTRQFRQEDDPSVVPDASIEHLRGLEAVLRSWSELREPA